jgi:hypothetical protein
MAKQRTKDVIVAVNVTAEDIAEGRESDCWECPVARALSRAVGDDVHVYFGSISDGGGMWERHLPRTASDFQRRFDKGQPVEPFGFEASVPQWYVSTAAASVREGR